MKSNFCKKVFPVLLILFINENFYSQKVPSGFDYESLVTDESTDGTVADSETTSDELAGESLASDDVLSADMSDSATSDEMSTDATDVEVSDSDTTTGDSTDDAFSESSDLDSLFETEDTYEQVVTEPVKPQETKKSNKGIVFTGNLEAILGGQLMFKPYDAIPGAMFESLISFTCRPNDVFSVKGSLLAAFPKMELGLYELYFNYVLWHRAYITAGKTTFTWGNAKIFDTNILDDRNNYVYDPTELLIYSPRDLENPRFAVSVHVPLGPVSVTGITYYEGTQTIDKKTGEVITKTPSNPYSITSRDFSFAAMVEANISDFSFDIFARTWAPSMMYRMEPCFGTNLNFTLKDFHFYAQGVFHYYMNKDIDKLVFPRIKGTASVWYITREVADLGFILEYQVVYDWDSYKTNEGPDEPSKYIKQYLAFEGAWGRVFGSKISLAVKLFHDFNREYGNVIPGFKIHDLIPYAQVDIGFPIYYGNKTYINNSGKVLDNFANQFGVGIQIKLRVDY